MYLLNPDKAPLPWRSYCALTPPFPVDQVSKYPPVGIFIGVMSTATAVERRMLIRSTWASHARSRGSDGSTDRTIVRFILGIPQSDWTRRIQLEAECAFQPYNPSMVHLISFDRSLQRHDPPSCLRKHE